jgi:hypothetical protein
VHPKVTAPWEIPAHEAHSFLTDPTRNKKNDTKCNTSNGYCEVNIDTCRVAPFTKNEMLYLKN